MEMNTELLQGRLSGGAVFHHIGWDESGIFAVSASHVISKMQQ